MGVVASSVLRYRRRWRVDTNAQPIPPDQTTVLAVAVPTDDQYVEFWESVGRHWSLGFRARVEGLACLLHSPTSTARGSQTVVLRPILVTTGRCDASPLAVHRVKGRCGAGVRFHTHTQPNLSQQQRSSWPSVQDLCVAMDTLRDANVVSECILTGNGIIVVDRDPQYWQSPSRDDVYALTRRMTTRLMRDAGCEPNWRDVRSILCEEFGLRVQMHHRPPTTEHAWEGDGDTEGL